MCVCSTRVPGAGESAGVKVFFTHLYLPASFDQLQLQAGFAGTRVKMVKSTLRHGVCCVRQLNILLALNEITQ